MIMASFRQRAVVRLTAGAWVCASALGSAQALAQDRPNESDIFGAPSTPATSENPDKTGPAPAHDAASSAAANGGETAPPAATPGNPTGPASDARDSLALGGTPMFTGATPPDDPLTIGGQIYMRGQMSGRDGGRFEDSGLNLPTLLDVFFDVRPNDRVRGFVLGRMSFDPLLPASGAIPTAATTGSNDTGTAGSATLSSAFATQTNAPHVLLDQLWLRFDISHTLFITAGRQHVRWGTAHFWTPTDYLHLTKRNPLDVFDARTGTTMLKVHLPIESKSWNFYAYGVTEGQNAMPSLATPAAAARAEFVFDTLEVGAGVFSRLHEHAKFALDASIGIGDIDFYGEFALLDGRNSDRVSFNPGAQQPQMAMPQPGQTTADVQTAYANQLIDAYYPIYRVRGYRPQGVLGLNYTRRYNDNDTFSIGAEYFYNGLGYTDPNDYSGLVYHQNLQNPASFFYLGKHYGGVFITFPAPFKLDLHTFTLSTLGNLSDRSFITRLDYSYQLLTHLRLDAWASVDYGEKGEFRFTPFIPNGINVPSSLRYGPLYQIGIGLRLAI
jgi:hypothetical protein